MSHRGGGGAGGGRRPFSGKDNQQHSSPSLSFEGRGRGRGRGRGGRDCGRGSGSGYASASASAYPQPSLPVSPASVQSLRTSTMLVSPQAEASTSRAPAPADHSASSSGSVEELRRQVEEKLTTSDSISKAATPPASSKAVRFPLMPGFGNRGMKVLVRANHFLVEIADRDLFHYDVTITPEVISKKVNRVVLKELVETYSGSRLGNRKPAYDGRKNLYTAGPLPFESEEFIVKLPDKSGSASGSKRREREFKVAIKFAAKSDISHLRQFLSGGRQGQLDIPQETIQILDIVLRASPSNSYTTVGRSFFSPQLGAKGELGDGIEFWRGFYQSLRPTQMGLSLNIDVSARSFYEPILVTNYVAKYFNLRDLSKPLSEQDRTRIKKVLKGLRVDLTYRDNAKNHKISGISSQPLNQIFFTLDDKITTVSIVDYYRKRYNIVLRYPALPALQAGSDSNPILLPMELCKIVEGQRYTKKLNERQVSALLKATCQRPNERERSIQEMRKGNKYDQDKLVSCEFGIQVRNDLKVVEARVLPPPVLKYHDTGKEKEVDPRQGHWNMINKKMVNGGTVEFWTCVNFSRHVNPDLPREFCRQLIQMCTSKGMKFNPEPVVPIQSAHPNQIESILADVHRRCSSKLVNQRGKQLQLLIIVLPDFTGTYGKIKRICETELGIVSQCCKPDQASRLNKQYLENVSLKINVKVGGRNTVLNDALLRRIPRLTDIPTIVFGADVTHPSPGEDSSPSIAAVVASVDWPEVTKYRGIVSAQPHREEIIQDLYNYKTHEDPEKGLVHSGIVREMLIAFRRQTGQKPKRIIFFRDGVSEGQFSQVLLSEVDDIRKACNSLEEDYLPPITFIVVQKRHHTRLFPVDGKHIDKSGNVLPGTVIDSNICHPTEFDFYLNSHAGIKGTSRPAHYHVLFDENNFSADELQVLTNNLCYTYARCTRSVSIVPPAYYAHLAAFRARYYMEGNTSSDGGSSSAGGRNREVQTLPAVKDNVKNVMFFC